MSERLKGIFKKGALAAGNATLIAEGFLGAATPAAAQESGFPPIPQRASRASSWDGCNTEYVSPYGRTLSPNEEPNPNGALPPTPENLSLPGATIAYHACNGEPAAVYPARPQSVRVVRNVPQR